MSDASQLSATELRLVGAFFGELALPQMQIGNCNTLNMKELLIKIAIRGMISIIVRIHRHH